MTKHISADSGHVLFGVRLIVEKQSIDNVWQSHRWIIYDLIPMSLSAGDGLPPSNDIHFQRLHVGGEEGANGSLFTAEASLDLHRAEAEAYAENLASAEPSIYAVLRKNEDDDDNDDGEIDIHLAEISLSPYNIQDYEDCGEDQVEKLPLQGPIARFVRDFVSIHFKPQPFKKRKRDKAMIERDEFGRADSRLQMKEKALGVMPAQGKRDKYH